MSQQDFLIKFVQGRLSDGDTCKDLSVRITEDGLTLFYEGMFKDIPIVNRRNGKLTVIPAANSPEQRRISEAVKHALDASLHVLEHNLTEEAARASHQSLRDLAKNDRPTLRHLINLFKLYRGGDPQLSSKEAKISMEAILTKWADEDPESAHVFGNLEWKPDQIVWMSFFDGVGAQAFGTYLDINNIDEIPDVPGDEKAEIKKTPKFPDYDFDRDEEAESEKFDPEIFLQ